MAKIEIYSTAVCPYFVRAKQLFKSKNAEFIEIRIDQDDTKREEMISRSQRKSVPQIFIDDKHIGGFDDLHALDKAGELDRLLKK
jgi:glutaredoxin 3